MALKFKLSLNNTMCNNSVWSPQPRVSLYRPQSYEKAENNDGSECCHGILATSPSFTKVELPLFEPMRWQIRFCPLFIDSGEELDASPSRTNHINSKSLCFPNDLFLDPERKWFIASERVVLSIIKDYEILMYRIFKRKKTAQRD